MEVKGRRVLIIDDQREQVDFLTDALGREGLTVTHSPDGESALHRIKAWKPHLIIFNVEMKDPVLKAGDLIHKIRTATESDYSCIIAVCSRTLTELAVDDFIVKPIHIAELSFRFRAMIRLKDLQDSLRRANHRIEELASADELTGLLNMRALQRRGSDEIEKSKRFRKPVSALVINIDCFSMLNETADFYFGSQVIKDLAALIKKCVRSVDMVARVGGDEFFLVLPETDLAGAEFVAERIRDAIESCNFKSDKHVAKLTACIGVAGFSYDKVDGDMKVLIHNAGEALKSAKASGINRIEIYSFV